MSAANRATFNYEGGPVFLIRFAQFVLGLCPLATGSTSSSVREAKTGRRMDDLAEALVKILILAPELDDVSVTVFADRRTIATRNPMR